jgi:hypothetical protein
MIAPFLTFRCVKHRLKLLDVGYSSYKNGGGYFRGPDQAINDTLPYEARIPCFVADRPDDTPVDAETINGWLQTMGLTEMQVAQFWSIQDHGELGQATTGTTP